MKIQITADDKKLGMNPLELKAAVARIEDLGLLNHDATLKVGNGFRGQIQSLTVTS